MSTTSNLNFLHNQLVDVCVKTIQEISTDNASRLDGCATDITAALAEGIFLAPDYFAFLKRHRQFDKLDQFRDKNILINSYLHPLFFQNIPFSISPTGNLPSTFRICPNVTPIDALKTARTGISILDCGTSCQIADYEAIAKIVGIEKFNALFAASSPSALVIGMKLRNNPIKCLRTEKKLSSVKKGDLCYISNVTTYGEKHPIGNSSGYYCICVDDNQESPKFTALGLRSQALTKVEIDKILIEAYNQPPDWSFEDVSEKVQKIFKETFEPFKEFAHSIIDSESYAQLNGGKITHIWEFNLERISLLVQNSISESKQLLSAWLQEIR